MKPWLPLLTDELAVRARAALAKMMDWLKTVQVSEGTLAGQAGLAIAFAHAYPHLPGHGLDAKALEALDRAGEWLESRSELSTLGLSLHMGIAGVAFAYQEVAAVLGQEPADDIHQWVDQALVELLERAPPREYDLIGGLSGIGVYCARQLARGGTSQAWDGLVSRLMELRARSPEGQSWRVELDMLSRPRRALYPQGRQSLGASHGVWGPIACLAQAVNRGRRELLSALEESIRWTLDHRVEGLLPEDVGKPAYPYINWCHGNLGAAGTLAWVGEVLNQPELKESARQMIWTLLSAPKPRAPGLTLCHGEFGEAHLVHRLGHHLDDEGLRAHARKQYARSLEVWEQTPSAQWTPGVLFGVPGWALCLTAALSPVEPGWDQLLLASPPR